MKEKAGSGLIQNRRMKGTADRTGSEEDGLQILQPDAEETETMK